MKRNNVQTTMIKKKMRINLLPLAIAKRAPKKPPKALHAAMGNAMAQRIFPCIMNKVIDPRLVARLTILACVEAPKKSNPSMAIKARIKKLPVPGPINPS